MIVLQHAQTAGQRVCVRDIIRLAAEAEGLDPADLIARSKRPNVARTRQRAMYVARCLRERASFPFLGGQFGGRHHTTIIHGVRATQMRIDRGENYERAAIESLIRCVLAPAGVGQ